MPDKPNILVVGSINMDMVVRAVRMPAPGETVLGEAFATSPGGKGANQAVAVARLGGACRMIGRVGRDVFGERLVSGLENEGIDCTHVRKTPEAPSGVAFIVVDSTGENSIVVAGGANRTLTPDDVFSLEDVFADSAVVLLQLELPLPTVRAAVDLARRNACKIILDPAPVPTNMPATLFDVDVICPNATEAEQLAKYDAFEERKDRRVASDLIERGAKAAILKLGSRGCLVAVADGHFYRVRAYKVPVEDTTAAGDAFMGAIAVAVAQGDNLHQAAKFATAAGALACTKLGAQSAMPTADEVRFLIADQSLD